MNEMTFGAATTIAPMIEATTSHRAENMSEMKPNESDSMIAYSNTSFRLLQYSVKSIFVDVPGAPCRARTCDLTRVKGAL